MGAHGTSGVALEHDVVLHQECDWPDGIVKVGVSMMGWVHGAWAIRSVSGRVWKGEGSTMSGRRKPLEVCS